MPTIKPKEAIATVFQNFWNQEQTITVGQLCLKENLQLEVVHQMIAEELMLRDFLSLSGRKGYS